MRTRQSEELSPRTVRRRVRGKNKDRLAAVFPRDQPFKAAAPATATA